MNDQKLKVLVIQPMKKPYVKEIDPELKSLQREVGGYIQVVYPWVEPCGILCDEEAKLTGKELNRALCDEDGHVYDVVAGTFLIVGLGEEDFISLTDEQIQICQEKFSVPEMFLRIGDKLLVLPGGDLK